VLSRWPRAGPTPAASTVAQLVCHGLPAPLSAAHVPPFPCKRVVGLVLCGPKQGPGGVASEAGEQGGHQHRLSRGSLLLLEERLADGVPLDLLSDHELELQARRERSTSARRPLVVASMSTGTGGKMADARARSRCSPAAGPWQRSSWPKPRRPTWRQRRQPQTAS